MPFGNVVVDRALAEPSQELVDQVGIGWRADRVDIREQNVEHRSHAIDGLGRPDRLRQTENRGGPEFLQLRRHLMKPLPLLSRPGWHPPLDRRQLEIAEIQTHLFVAHVVIGSTSRGIPQVRADDLPALHSFVTGLEHDFAALAAGLTLPWSNGPTEGTVNKLKHQKRQCFGRAKLDLLRKRLLLTHATVDQQTSAK